MRVAILGGGPAGAMAAGRLAAAGVEATVLDEKLAWEKPCGGAITRKAYGPYPFFLENGAPKRMVHRTIMISERGRSAEVELRSPLVIYERKELNGMLLDRAARAGARIEKERVTGLERAGRGWRVLTRSGTLEADWCVVATGARNRLPGVGSEWRAEDAAATMGYLIPGRQEDAEIHFLRGLEGYLWVFPRLERLSVGICGKGESSASLRARLEKFMATRGMAAGQAEFFAHAIPCLEPDAWTRNRVAGDGWLAAGDAAGLVDPLTGEGISYAIRSGDLAAQTLLDDGVAAEGKPAAYRRILKEEMMDELAAGSRLSRPFFRERFLWGSVPARMIWLLRRHETFRAVAGDLVAGTLSYRNLKQRLVEAAEGSAAGLVLRAGLALRRVISSRRTAGAGWKQWQGEEAS